VAGSLRRNSQYLSRPCRWIWSCCEGPLNKSHFRITKGHHYCTYQGRKQDLDRRWRTRTICWYARTCRLEMLSGLRSFQIHSIDAVVCCCWTSWWQSPRPRCVPCQALHW
jgi:hypothetical protein